MPKRNIIREGFPLSPRELDVLECLTYCDRLTDIADVLCISRTTIRTHLNSIYIKFKARSQNVAVAVGYQSGYLSIGEDYRVI